MIEVISSIQVFRDSMILINFRGNSLIPMPYNLARLTPGYLDTGWRIHPADFGRGMLFISTICALWSANGFRCNQERPYGVFSKQIHWVH